MTRKIKFRGKDEQGEWQEGHLLVQLGTHYILTPIWEMYRNEYVETDRSTKHRVSACTVSQFTGLLDKNGREIYEGDIVKSTFTTYIVTWDKECACFSLKEDNTPHLLADYIDDIEVVGNIYDNPELLNK